MHDWNCSTGEWVCLRCGLHGGSATAPTMSATNHPCVSPAPKTINVHDLGRAGVGIMEAEAVKWKERAERDERERDAAKAEAARLKEELQQERGMFTCSRCEGPRGVKIFNAEPVCALCLAAEEASALIKKNDHLRKMVKDCGALLADYYGEGINLEQNEGHTQPELMLIRIDAEVGRE